MNNNTNKIITTTNLTTKGLTMHHMEIRVAIAAAVVVAVEANEMITINPETHTTQGENNTSRKTKSTTQRANNKKNMRMFNLQSNNIMMMKKIN